MFTNGVGFVFAVRVLPVIIFFSSLIAVLYYLGVMQWVVKIIGGSLQKILKTILVEPCWILVESLWNIVESLWGSLWDQPEIWETNRNSCLWFCISKMHENYLRVFLMLKHLIQQRLRATHCLG